MTGYNRKWRCRICNTGQESIDLPRMQVCENCLLPVADYLCLMELKVGLETRGVDQEYWMRRADSVVGPMMARWQPVRDNE